MKKRILATLFAIVTALCLFAGCSKKEGETLSGSMKIVITESASATATVIDVDLQNFKSTDSVMDVIDSLTDSQKLCYKGTKGVYGIYLTALGVPKQVEYNGQTSLSDSFILEESATEGKYLYTYTSVEADQLEVQEGYTAKTVEYGGKTLVESMNGVSKMHLADGAVVYFTYIIWG